MQLATPLLAKKLSPVRCFLQDIFNGDILFLLFYLETVLLFCPSLLRCIIIDMWHYVSLCQIAYLIHL